MNPRNPGFRAAVEEIFRDAEFIRGLGLEVADLGPGWCETELRLRPDHRQQHGFAHAGVQATVADHTAGAAGTTLVGTGECVLTVEFKVNLFRPADGRVLRCRAQVLRNGRSLIVAESDLWAEEAGRSIRTAKALVTLAVRDRPGSPIAPSEDR